MAEETADPRVQQYWKDYLATLSESKRALQNFPSGLGFRLWR